MYVAQDSRRALQMMRESARWCNARYTAVNVWLGAPRPRFDPTETRGCGRVARHPTTRSRSVWHASVRWPGRRRVAQHPNDSIAIRVPSIEGPAHTAPRELSAMARCTPCRRAPSTHQRRTPTHPHDAGRDLNLPFCCSSLRYNAQVHQRAITGTVIDQCKESPPGGERE